jgi:hypothetical protein
MRRPEVLTLRFYRQTPGDVAVAFNRAPVPGDDLAKAKRTACSALLSYNRDCKTPPQNRPHTVDLIGEDGRVVATLRIPHQGDECEELNA